MLDKITVEIHSLGEGVNVHVFVDGVDRIILLVVNMDGHKTDTVVTDPGEIAAVRGTVHDIRHRLEVRENLLYSLFRKLKLLTFEVCKTGCTAIFNDGDFNIVFLG